MVIVVVVLVLLAGRSVAQGGDSAGSTGTTVSAGAKAPGGETKSPGSASTTAKAGGAKGAGDGKAASPVLAPLTGSIGSIYTGGWSGLGGGFIGDFGPQYGTYAGGFGMGEVSMYGPMGMYGQYGMYGPFGMYGPCGPSFGSGLGFGGFGAHDIWALYKQANMVWAAQGT